MGEGRAEKVDGEDMGVEGARMGDDEEEESGAEMKMGDVGDVDGDNEGEEG